MSEEKTETQNKVLSREDVIVLEEYKVLQQRLINILDRRRATLHLVIVAIPAFISICYAYDLTELIPYSFALLWALSLVLLKIKNWGYLIVTYISEVIEKNHFQSILNFESISPKIDPGKIYTDVAVLVAYNILIVVTFASGLGSNYKDWFTSSLIPSWCILIIGLISQIVIIVKLNKSENFREKWNNELFPSV